MNEEDNQTHDYEESMETYKLTIHSQPRRVAVNMWKRNVESPIYAALPCAVLPPPQQCRSAHQPQRKPHQ